MQGFTPDGRSVVFTSPRAVYTGRYTQLFTVPATGGVETPLPIPHASRASYSPDGKPDRLRPARSAVPAVEALSRRPGLDGRDLRHGSRTRSRRFRSLPSRANDVDPVWVGETVYFRSDRDGEFNVYAYDTKAKQVRADHPVTTTSRSSASRPAAGTSSTSRPDICTCSIRRTAQTKKLTFAVPSDLRETRPRFVRGAKWIRDASLSPSGARAAFEFRGEIVTVPAEKGDVRNLTTERRRPRARRRSGRRTARASPTSPTRAASTSSSSRRRTARASRKCIPLDGHGFYESPVWSPDSQKIAYMDNSQSLYWIDLKTGRLEEDRVAGDLHAVVTTARAPGRRTRNGSPTRIGTRPLVMAVSVYSVEQDKSFAVTDGLAEVTEPVFDRSGKYLYFFGSTDAGPVLDWFSQSSSDMRETRNVYLTVLRKDLPSPLAKESDEEGAKNSKDANDTKGPERRQGITGQARVACGRARRRRDGRYAAHRDPVPDGPGRHPVPHPRHADSGRQPVAPAGRQRRAGLFHPRDRRQADAAAVRPREAQARDRACGRRRTTTCRRTARRSSTGRTIPGSSVPRRRKLKAGEGKIATDAIEVKVDPRAEWTQIFNEAWRINRDYFYDPGMHGVDWTAARAKYAAFLPDVTTAKRSQPRHAVDGERAERRASPPDLARRCACLGPRRARRAARRGLQRRERPLPVQEGVRRPELDAAAARRR